MPSRCTVRLVVLDRDGDEYGDHGRSNQHAGDEVGQDWWRGCVWRCCSSRQCTLQRPAKPLHSCCRRRDSGPIALTRDRGLNGASYAWGGIQPAVVPIDRHGAAVRGLADLRRMQELAAVVGSPCRRPRASRVSRDLPREHAAFLGVVKGRGRQRFQVSVRHL